METALISEPKSSPPAASPDNVTVRRLSETARHAMEPFQGSEALSHGKVNLIGLDAIVEALAERWQSRREQIYEHVERVLARNLGPNGFFVRVSETDFLVAQPDLGVFAAQATCLRALNEVLKHFLGAVSVRGMSVLRVQTLSNTEIVAVPVDPKQAAEGERREVQAAASAAAVAAAAEAERRLLSPERWSPFVAGNGRKVRVSCKLEPVFELKGNTRIGYRLNRRVIDVETDETMSPDAVRNLSRGDLLKIDMATISRGLMRLNAASEADQALSLIIPVSYITLSNHNGRNLLATAFNQARQKVLAGVICEVCDIEDVPQGPLLSAVSLIRPWSVFVIGHLFDETPRAASYMRDAGIQAVSMTCPTHIDGDAEFLGWAKDAIRAANRVSRSAMVYGCTPKRIALAGLMGASHASVGA